MICARQRVSPLVVFPDTSRDRHEGLIENQSILPHNLASINSEEDVSSGREFVDATQDNEQHKDENLTTNHNVQQDMEFLK